MSVFIHPIINKVKIGPLFLNMSFKCLVLILVIAVFFMTFVLIFQIKIPKGIPAGGIRISVSGKNLAYIQNPQMYVYYKDRMFGSVSNYVYLAVYK
jgi:hypothetical protein